MLNHYTTRLCRPKPASFLFISFTIAVTFFATACFAGNPFITSIYTADPAAHVWSDGRLYVYASHDMDPPRGCDLMDRYHVFSTSDMVNWRDEGEILRSSEIVWSQPPGGFMWAPDCAYANGKYYFYFPHPSDPGETGWNRTWKIGIATSLSPCRDFTPLTNYIQGVGGFSMIDPDVFVDTDGQAYLFYGGGGNCAVARLNQDMISIKGSAQAVTNLNNFHEGTWVFERNNLYYLTYADNHPDYNQLEYATATNVMGPWTSRGVYLYSTGCSTSQGSAVEYHGQWYQFYHNQSISGQGNLRSICVDLVNFDGNGSILPVIQTTNGPPANGSAPPPGTNTVIYSVTNGIVGNGAILASDSAARDGWCVQNLHLSSNSFFELTNVDGGSIGGLTSAEIHFAEQLNGSKLRLTVNGDDYSYINMLNTGGWSSFTGNACLTVRLSAGRTNVVVFNGGNGGINVDYVAFTPLPPSQ
ncbi:MAG: family 43 glycosylhydrolase [Verrucomicrobiota bacterium]